jgi:hypothetical protein
MPKKKLTARQSLKLTIKKHKLSPARKRILLAATKKAVKNYKKTLQKLGKN